MGAQTRDEREAQREAAIAAFAPAMAYLREHHHAHTLAIVRDDRFEILEGIMGHIEPESAQQAVEVDAIRADAELILSELDAVTAYTDDASDRIGCAEIAATRIIAALPGKTEVDRG